MKDKLILLSILLFCCLQAFPQQDSIDINTVISKTKQVSEIRPIEKVYLHFDKPFYAIGDTMWFKAYLTFGLHMPSELSKIVYVDVINSRDSLVRTLLLPVTNGTSSGSIAITQAAFKQDSYHIRAYTKWMINFEEAYFFNKTINIGSAIDKEVNTLISLKRSTSNNLPLITTDIIFKDMDGNPYANKKVDWYVGSGLFNAIADGKGSTDRNGLLSISFVNSKSSDLTKAILTTSLDAGKNKTRELTFSLKSVAAAADVQFFPEGGNLIGGVPTKVAVKAVQSNGLGADFTATITDNIGNTIANCTSQHAGMGVFIMSPQSGRNYKLNVEFKDGSKGVYDLPKIQASGFNLSVNNTDTSKIVIKLMADSTYLKSHLNKTYYLIGKSGQTVCYAAQTILSNAVFSAAIPSSKFPTGIAQFTLMTSSGQPLSERIVFIRHDDLLDVAISTDRKSYAPRQKIQLNVTAANNSKPVEADLSISVIDESKVTVNESTETTILSSLLLTSDLKGYIENPNYYFSRINEKTAADLDVLMLTQGYRRFTYEQILSGKVPDVAYLPEQGIEITGTLRNLTGMPLKGGRVTLQIPDRYYSVETVSDSEGKFKFANLVFPDSTRMVVHAKNNLAAKTMMLMIDGVAYPALGKNLNSADENLNIDTLMVSYLKNARRIYEGANVLKEVVIKSTSLVKGPSFLDHSVLAGLSPSNANRIPGDRFKDCNNLLECMKVMAAGVTYDVSTSSFYVSRYYNSGMRIPMALSVRGMFVEATHLSTINPNDIESIEVFLRDDQGLVDRANNTNGVLVVNMKVAAPVQGTRVTMQQLQEMIPQPYLIKMAPPGYTISKQFYSPKYIPGSTGFGADLRSTIYWNPKLITDNTGKASVEFFSADAKGTYRAVVQGLNKDGQIAYSIYRFNVE